MPEAVSQPARGTGELRAVEAGTDTAGLRDEVARTVLSHPGVLRLEPTLLGTVRGWGRRDGDGQDGVAVGVHGRVVDLDVNLATRADRQARASVMELQRQLRDLVERHGFVPGTLEISVLAVEPAA